MSLLAGSQCCRNGNGGVLSSKSSSQHSNAERLIRDFQKSGSDAPSGSGGSATVVFALGFLTTGAACRASIRPIAPVSGRSLLEVVCFFASGSSFGILDDDA